MLKFNVSSMYSCSAANYCYKTQYPAWVLLNCVCIFAHFTTTDLLIHLSLFPARTLVLKGVLSRPLTKWDKPWHLSHLTVFLVFILWEKKDEFVICSLAEISPFLVSLPLPCCLYSSPQRENLSLSVLDASSLSRYWTKKEPSVILRHSHLQRSGKW